MPEPADGNGYDDAGPPQPDSPSDDHGQPASEQNVDVDPPDLQPWCTPPDDTGRSNFLASSSRSRLLSGIRRDHDDPSRVIGMRRIPDRRFHTDLDFRSRSPPRRGVQPPPLPDHLAGLGSGGASRQRLHRFNFAGRPRTGNGHGLAMGRPPE